MEVVYIIYLQMDNYYNEWKIILQQGKESCYVLQSLSDNIHLMFHDLPSLTQHSLTTKLASINQTLSQLQTSKLWFKIFLC